jgi:hypothetical protein
MRRMQGHGGVLAVALCVVVSTSATSGCSFLLVDAPPDNHKKLKTFSCTTSNTWPTVDIIAGGLMAIDGVAAIADPASYSTTGTGQANYVAAGAFLASAALFATSAAVGYRRTSDCRDATGELMMRIYPGPTAAPGFAPYPPMAPPQPYDPWNTPAPAAAPPLGAPPPGAASPGTWGAPAAPAPPPAGPPPAAPPPASGGGAPK